MLNVLSVVVAFSIKQNETLKVADCKAIYLPAQERTIL